MDVNDDIELVPISYYKHGNKWKEERHVDRITRAVYQAEISTRTATKKKSPKKRGSQGCFKGLSYRTKGFNEN